MCNPASQLSSDDTRKHIAIYLYFGGFSKTTIASFAFPSENFFFFRCFHHVRCSEGDTRCAAVYSTVYLVWTCRALWEDRAARLAC